MRLVDGDEADQAVVAHLAQAGEEVRVGGGISVFGFEPGADDLLGGDVDDPVLPAQGRGLHARVRLLRAEETRERAGGFFVVGSGSCSGTGGVVEVRDLVVHERDERRDHERGLARVQRRELVAQGLAAPRGPVHARVAAGDERRDDLELPRAEVVVAEVRPERRAQGGRERGGARERRAREIGVGGGRGRGGGGARRRHGRVHHREELGVVQLILRDLERHRERGEA